MFIRRSYGAPVDSLQKADQQCLSSAQQSLWSPVTVSIVCAEGETCSGFAVPIDLLREPLKPFPILLRTCTVSFVFDVAVQLAPCDAHCAAQQFVDYVQRNHARKHRITERFKNASYGLDGLKNTRIALTL